MSRVLITVLPLIGHLNPALGIAHALKEQGHEIAWAVDERRLFGHLPANDVVYPLDIASGEIPEIAGAAVGFESVRFFFEEYALPLASRVLSRLEAAFLDFEPDIALVDQHMLAGALVASKLDLPWITLVPTSAAILQISTALDAWTTQQFEALQISYLPASKITARPDLSPHQVFVCSIESLAKGIYSVPDAPYLFLGPVSLAGRENIEFPWEWLDPAKLGILISLGTISRDRDTRFFETMMVAMAELPKLQAVMVAPIALADRAPANVLVRQYVPQLEILDRVSGVICHAGHNTVCESLSRNLPLLVAPIRDDQPVVARQVIDAGAAVYLRHGKVTPPVARAAIERLMNDEALRDGARGLGQELRMAPGATGAAKIVTNLIQARR